jgi:hypothetical protein
MNLALWKVASKICRQGHHDGEEWQRASDHGDRQVMVGHRAYPDWVEENESWHMNFCRSIWICAEAVGETCEEATVRRTFGAERGFQLNGDIRISEHLLLHLCHLCHPIHHLWTGPRPHTHHTHHVLSHVLSLGNHHGRLFPPYLHHCHPV